MVEYKAEILPIFDSNFGRNLPEIYWPLENKSKVRKSKQRSAKALIEVPISKA